MPQPIQDDYEGNRAELTGDGERPVVYSLDAEGKVTKAPAFDLAQPPATPAEPEALPEVDFAAMEELAELDPVEPESPESPLSPPEAAVPQAPDASQVDVPQVADASQDGPTADVQNIFAEQQVMDDLSIVAANPKAPKWKTDRARAADANAAQQQLLSQEANVVPPAAVAPQVPIAPVDDAMDELGEVADRELPPAQQQAAGIPRDKIEKVAFPQDEERVGDTLADYLMAEKEKWKALLALLNLMARNSNDDRMELEKIQAYLERSRG